MSVVDRVLFFVEEPSAEAALRTIVPAIVPGLDFDILVFQGKRDLLKQLDGRLRGYARFMHSTWRIVVLIDRDQDDCRALRQQIDGKIQAAGLRLRTSPRDASWQAVTRVAIEELEAWYFGDWQAVRDAYPKLPSKVPGRAAFRDPDAIAGGTAEQLERHLQHAGYFKTGLRKVELATAIAEHMVPERNRSASFRKFNQLLKAL
ncbi:MAG: DUF4276 family protein [Polyangia bacterium]